MELNYLIIGAQRCGTTSMMHYIGEHPDVVFDARKEVRYFTSYYQRGPRWYEKQLGRKVPNKLRGEKSPDYLYKITARNRIARDAPDVKLIVLLRDPVERALSNYRLRVHLKSERRPFEVAVWDPTHPEYLARGRYAEQLGRWFECFTRDQFLILCSKNFYRSPVTEYVKVLQFLGLRSFTPRFKQHGIVNARAQMNISTRKKLTEYFEPYNRDLYELLGRDFGWSRWVPAS